MGISKQNNWIEVPASREDEDPQSALAHSDFFPHYTFHCDSCPSMSGPHVSVYVHSFPPTTTLDPTTDSFPGGQRETQIVLHF